MLNSIQIFRGIAALAVVAFHLSILMGMSRYGGVESFRDFTLHGNLGVDFFFVLSGFIILHAHQKDIGNSASLIEYLTKRFIRVYPIYWIYSLGFVVLVLIGLGSSTNLPNSLGGWVSTFSLIRFSSESPPIAPGWTLFHEVFFYLTFSLLIINKTFGKLCLFIWFCFILKHFHYVSEQERNALNVYLSLHNINFFLGMGSYLLYKACTDIKAIFLLVVGMILLWAAANMNFGIGAYNQLTYGLSFALILSGFAVLDHKIIIKKSSIFLLLGNASYSIYLLHLMFLGLLLKILICTNVYFYFGDKAVFILAFILTLVCSTLVYLLIEKPLLSRVRVYFLNRLNK